MTTTNEFQKLPDFYTSEEDCKKHMVSRINTNPRYVKYTQVHFTAGDMDQFLQYKDPSNGDNSKVGIDMTPNVWKDMNIGENVEWKKYKNITTDAVLNTFRYMFEKFKKGVFIKIKNNKLAVFLPFSNNNYANEWGDRMKHDPSFSDMTEFLIYASKMQGYDIIPEKVNKFTNRWYGNNCLIRTEYPVGENDRGMSNLKDMLLSVCENRIVPDIEFFVNKRDFPVIKKDDTEPYEQIFDSEKYPLISHRYDKYCPILSMVTTDTNADIPFPTMEDWARVSSQEDNKFFAPDCRNYKYKFSKNWNEKIPTAIFRGGSTGCGVDIDTNPRLKVSYLSTISPIEDGFKLLDAGITKWNLRPRKIMENPYLQVIDIKKLPFGLVNSLSPVEQSNYKYIINVDGHVSAFRLSLELSMGSVVLLAESRYRMWFRKYLQEYVHYVPIKSDLSDLFEKIRWCRENDAKCKEIAENAFVFYNKYLKKNGILDYIQALFFKMKDISGTYFYNTMKIEDIVSLKQEKILESQLYLYDKKVVKLSYPFDTRDFYGLTGLQHYLNSIQNSKNKFIELKSKNIVHESKDTRVFVGHIQGMENIKLLEKISERKSEIINEAFCGITEINKIVRELPNFKYTYMFSEESVISEYIDGQTFKKFINDGCSLKQMNEILMMLCLALAVAQEKIGFVHYDLYPWNIIITKKSKKEKIVYQVKDLIFEVETDIIPVIVDYGRCHVIHDQKHYGTIDPFKMNVFQDCFCMLVSSVAEILDHRKHDQKTINTLIYMINFFSKTDFQKEKIENFKDLMNFLSKHKKYNEMIFGNKCGLENKNPIELFFHLSTIEIDIDIKQVVYPDKASYNVPINNPLFYYDIILGQDPSNDIFEYLENIEMSYDQILYRSKNILSFINTCNTLTIGIQNVIEFLKKYQTYISDKNLEKICKRILEKISINYYTNFADKRKEIKTGYYTINDKLITGMYNVNTFSIPEKILTIMQGDFDLKNTNLIIFRDMFIFNMFYEMPFKLENEEEFSLKYGKILEVSPLIINTHNSNINTIKSISEVVYKIDQNVFGKMKNKPIKTLEILKNILSLI